MIAKKALCSIRCKKDVKKMLRFRFVILCAMSLQAFGAVEEVSTVGCYCWSAKVHPEASRERRSAVVATDASVPPQTETPIRTNTWTGDSVPEPRMASSSIASTALDGSPVVSAPLLHQYTEIGASVRSLPSTAWTIDVPSSSSAARMSALIYSVDWYVQPYVAFISALIKNEGIVEKDVSLWVNALVGAIDWIEAEHKEILSKTVMTEFEVSKAFAAGTLEVTEVPTDLLESEKIPSIIQAVHMRRYYEPFLEFVYSLMTAKPRPIPEGKLQGFIESQVNAMPEGDRRKRTFINDEDVQACIRAQVNARPMGISNGVKPRFAEAIIREIRESASPKKSVAGQTRQAFYPTSDAGSLHREGSEGFLAALVSGGTSVGAELPGWAPSE